MSGGGDRGNWGCRNVCGKEGRGLRLCMCEWGHLEGIWVCVHMEGKGIMDIYVSIKRMCVSMCEQCMCVKHVMPLCVPVCLCLCVESVYVCTCVQTVWVHVCIWKVCIYIYVCVQSVCDRVFV